MFNRSQALIELEATLRTFYGAQVNFSIDNAKQQQLQLDLPELSVEEIKALLLIQQAMGDELKENHFKFNLSTTSENANSENQKQDTHPNSSIETKEQRYTSKIVDSLRRKLNAILAYEEKSLNRSDDGDKAFAIQIALAKLFPFNHVSETGKWLNPISLDDIDCESPNLIIFSQAPAITKADAQEFYKTNNAFNIQNSPKDYQGRLLNQREMESLIEQNIFPEIPPPIAIPSNKPKKWADTFSFFDGIFRMIGLFTISLLFSVDMALIVFLPLSFYLAIPFIATALFSLLIDFCIHPNHDESMTAGQRIFENLFYGSINGIVVTSIVLALAMIIPYGLTCFAVIPWATFLNNIDIITRVVVPIVASITGLISGLIYRSRANTIGGAIGCALGDVIVGLPVAVGQWMGKQLGRVFDSLFGQNVSVNANLHSRYEKKDMITLFNKYRGDQHQQISQPLQQSRRMTGFFGAEANALSIQLQHSRASELDNIFIDSLSVNFARQYREQAWQISNNHRQSSVTFMNFTGRTSTHTLLGIMDIQRVDSYSLPIVPTPSILVGDSNNLNDRFFQEPRWDQIPQNLISQPGRQGNLRR